MLILCTCILFYSTEPFNTLQCGMQPSSHHLSRKAFKINHRFLLSIYLLFLLRCCFISNFMVKNILTLNMLDRNNPFVFFLRHLTHQKLETREQRSCLPRVEEVQVRFHLVIVLSFLMSHVCQEIKISWQPARVEEVHCTFSLNQENNPTSLFPHRQLK